MKRKTFYTRGPWSVRALVAAGVLLAACGGSSGAAPDRAGGGNTPGTGGTIGGNAIKGPVGNGTVTAFALTNGAKGAQIATAPTDGQGHFTMDMGTHSGPVLLELHGGTFVDEATNGTMAMGSADVMTAVVPAFAAGSSVTIMMTPLTSMAQTMAQGMSGGMTDANIASANGGVGGYFDVDDILHTTPMDPLVPGSGTSATQAMKNYGMSIAAMSQYAHTVGMTVSSSGMVTAMMDDASDGVMNGKTGSTPIDMAGMGGMGSGMMGGGTMMSTTSGTSGLGSAMSEFVGSSMNRSGVPMSEMQPLIAKLTSSSGALK